MEKSLKDQAGNLLTNLLAILLIMKFPSDISIDESSNGYSTDESPSGNSS